MGSSRRRGRGTGDLNVRTARLDEVEALSDLALRSKAHWGYGEEFIERCRPLLRVPPDLVAAGRVLVAEREGRLAGVAALGDAAPDAELSFCFVEPGGLRAGVGRRLVEEAVERARQLGYRSVVVESDPNAEGFYLALGATRVGEVASDIDPERLLPLLRLDVRERAAPSRLPRARQAVANGLVALGWSVVVVLGLLLGGRLVAFDRARLLVLANAVAFWLYFPAYVVALGAALGRRWNLTGAAGVLVLAHLALVVPHLDPADPIPAAARRAPQIDVATVNLSYDNEVPGRLAAEIADLDVDVLVLQELTEQWVLRLATTGVRDAFPNRLEEPDEGATGAAIYSRLPLAATNVERVGGFPLLSANLEVEGRRIALMAVHPAQPLSMYDAHRRYARRLVDVVRGARDLDARLIVAGDFNATPYNRLLRDLEGAGLRSAHEERGRGLATTWPNGRLRVPPIRLDHIFVSGGVVPLSVREGRGAGSDHKPVVARLAVTGE